MLNDFHEIDSAVHYGETKTWHRLSRLFFCQTLRRDVAEYVRSCPLCKIIKSRSSNPFWLRQPRIKPDVKWSVIVIDFIGPLPETNKENRHILNVVDKLSKILKALPVPYDYYQIIVAKESRETVSCSNGLPEKILSYRDSIFMN